MQHERRKYQRYLLERKSVLMTDDHMVIVTRSRDISARGVTLITKTPLPKSKRYKISLALGDSTLDLAQGHYIEFTAELVDIVTIKILGLFRYGLIIVDIDPLFEQELAEFLDERLKQKKDRGGSDLKVICDCLAVT